MKKVIEEKLINMKEWDKNENWIEKQVNKCRQKTKQIISNKCF